MLSSRSRRSRPTDTGSQQAARPDVVKGRIQEFYLRSDISWMAPGHRDSIIVIRNGEKVREQRRYLMMTTAEAHALYQQEFPDDAAGLTTFRAQRPDVVLCKDKMPHSVCVCQYHANIQTILDSLKHIATIPATYVDLLQHVSCDTTMENCMFGRSDDCKEKIP